VKFTIDAQLPPALAQFLRDAGHDAKHVVEIGLERSDNSSIWNRAVSDPHTGLANPGKASYHAG
jgi:predicted nuclease of predicted toxin-antitoxin system